MSKTLVAYFSATGTTQALAKKISSLTDSDIYEIRPKVPYTTPDLDWNNPNSRSSLEMNDPTARPQLHDLDANIEAYDTILIGAPVWWYVAPRLIQTFLESYDFSGKRIVLFGTSGGSGYAPAINQIKESAGPMAQVVDAKVWNKNASEDALSKWLDAVLA